MIKDCTVGLNIEHWTLNESAVFNFTVVFVWKIKKKKIVQIQYFIIETYSAIFIINKSILI